MDFGLGIIAGELFVITIIVGLILQRLK